MSPTVTLEGSHGSRSRTSSSLSWSATIPSLATNGDWGRNCAITSRPLAGAEEVVIRPCCSPLTPPGRAGSIDGNDRKHGQFYQIYPDIRFGQGNHDQWCDG